MGTYSIIYLKEAQLAEEVNNFLKENFDLNYENFNGVDYGVFFTQAMFNEELRFLNEDEEGKKILAHYDRPLTTETYYSLLFGIGNCFGDIGTACIKVSSVIESDFKFIRALQKFKKTPEFIKYVDLKKSQHLQRLLSIRIE
ncbi:MULTISPECIES: hypothetical protein [Chryseobacterium group]|jgi:hypothetical protein|uniref:Uncharacterized protein n=4 Tax=Chryseobacterium TaxID=59732 RepID=A0AAJ1VJN5_9FLAO|nr:MULTISPECIES: hypothetical protein [Chryseobacterium group]EFK33170.1 hypothetical protein HMPREF0204_12238 [Chryseobacterium gleum ATCC 35910]MDN4013265.1 hypothetical protein [Chryseobacterium gambrini]MDN4028880.1 hypothetical protein [Chryseobacterium gambrini]MDO3425174.1 hypothetical protein [Chryseobacterium sp. APV1]QQY33984.1 hypothetical protein I6I60_09560 [Chryseobacterium gleum]